jgi:hypothetical protein
VKRGFTIFLLALFLLNVLGYYGVFLGLQVNNTRAMQARFDTDSYDQFHEVTVKVPLTVAYLNDSRDYVRVDGEFEHEGEVYRMVKQRYQSDTLYIVCVKDKASKKINQALTDYVKTFSDKPAGEKGNTKTIQNFIKDYMTHHHRVATGRYDGWNNSYHRKCLPEPIPICWHSAHRATP